MDLIVDGFIYSAQSHGGISRMFSEILPRMAELDQDLSIKVVAYPSVNNNFGEHVQKVIIPNLGKNLRPRRIWQKIIPYFDSMSAHLKLGNSLNKIFHSTYYRSFPGWRGLQVFSVYDMIYEKFPDNFVESPDIIKLKRNSFHKADCLICISQKTKEDLLDYYAIPENKVHVSYLAQSEQFQILAREQIKWQSPDPFFLYVGGRHKYKGFRDFINAFILWPHNLTYKLVVVGQGWNKAERQLIAESGLSERIRLVENASDSQICELYNSARAFIFPSRDEGFGIPLLEAMACGCPIVASDIPTTREVAGEIPIYFDVANVESLQVALNTCLCENRANSERILAGWKWAKKFSWEKTARDFINIYHGLL